MVSTWRTQLAVTGRASTEQASRRYKLLQEEACPCGHRLHFLGASPLRTGYTCNTKSSCRTQAFARAASAATGVSDRRLTGQARSYRRPQVARATTVAADGHWGLTRCRSQLKPPLQGVCVTDSAFCGNGFSRDRCVRQACGCRHEAIKKRRCDCRALFLCAGWRVIRRVGAWPLRRFRCVRCGCALSGDRGGDQVPAHGRSAVNRSRHRTSASG